MPERRMEYQPLRRIVRAPKNPKGHDAAGIAASISRHGFVEPVIVDERTGYLVGGHGRLEDLVRRRDAGESPPDGVVVADDDWLLPVVLGWASSSDADAEALLIGLNALPPRGGWDGRGLYEMLDSLASNPGGLEGTGYDADSLDDLLASLGVVELDLQDSDAAHAHLPDRGDPAVPREVQGLREVGLMFQAEHHREYLEHLVRLKRLWAEDAAPMVVLRAMREASTDD